jgi:hypothetical protein
VWSCNVAGVDSDFFADKVGIRQIEQSYAAQSIAQKTQKQRALGWVM